VTAASAAFAVAAVPSTAQPRGGDPIHLVSATLIVEISKTDGDAGLQFFVDGEPWRSMTIFAPDGEVMLEIDAQGRLENFGLTELFSESNEPPFDEFPLAKFKRRFPEGEYRFSGITIEGEPLVGRAILSHDFPHGPEILTPSVVDRDDFVAEWRPVTGPPGVDVVAYRAIVTREDPLQVFSVDLPATTTEVTVSPEFLRSGVEYELEVQAIEKSGNQTFSILMVRVR
jgi:Fibronectin type III domain